MHYICFLSIMLNKDKALDMNDLTRCSSGVAKTCVRYPGFTDIAMSTVDH